VKRRAVPPSDARPANDELPADAVAWIDELARGLIAAGVGFVDPPAASAANDIDPAPRPPMVITSERAPRPWPRFMTARVAADYADTSPWTIRRNVPACGRRGRSMVYSIEDVERWMRGEPLSRPGAAAIETPSPRVRPPATSREASLARLRRLSRARGKVADDEAA
jgi:hypothetical protein